MEKLTINLPVLLPDIPDVQDKCVARLITTLEGREGIDRVHIKTNGEPASQLCIHFDPEVVSLRHIKNLARQTGAKLQDTFGHLLVEVSGIRHPRHARSVTRRLQKLKGVVDAYAGATGWIRLEFNRSMVSEYNLLEAIEAMGLPVKQLANGYQDKHAHITLIDGNPDHSADQKLPAPDIDEGMHYAMKSVPEAEEIVPD